MVLKTYLGLYKLQRGAQVAAWLNIINSVYVIWNYIRVCHDIHLAKMMSTPYTNQFNGKINYAYILYNLHIIHPICINLLVNLIYYNYLFTYSHNCCLFINTYRSNYYSNIKHFIIIWS